MSSGATRPVVGMSLLQAMDDPNLFASWFRDPETWAAWRAFLASLFALPMSDEEVLLFRQCTGRTSSPTLPFREAWLVCGRRSGKSFALALIAVYLATFQDLRRFLAPGERATILIIATDRRQARTIFRYIRALLFEVPMLARMVERETADEFDLVNRVTVEVGTSSYRAVRGRTLAAALGDEIAFWPSEDSASPDYEVLDALRPALATIPGAMLLCASSPYARRGALYDAFKRYHGQDETSVLVWQAPTRIMNPTVPQAVVDAAMERDPASARAEFMAVFREGLELLFRREVVDAAVVPSRHELPPISGTRYVAFVDPSGGSADAMTLAVAHAEKDTIVLDAVRERRPPFSPEVVTAEFATTLKAYGLKTVTGDRYGGEWPRERFRVHGIEYVLAEKPRSDLYRDALPLLNSGKVELLDLPRLAAQLCGLERRTARGGRDSIDHAPGQHDDLANAVAGCLASLQGANDRRIGIGTVLGLY